MYEHILFEKSGAIATVTLNRPEKLNAYIPELGDEVVDAFRRLRDDAEVRAVILTGAGRAFCAGVDLDYLKERPPASRRPLGEEDFLRKFPLDLLTYPKAVIAAVNGHAIGAGVTMILPCDIRIAAAGAKMAVPFTRIGILPGLGSTHLLPRLVGRGKALELLLTSRTFLAEEALEMGLVNKVVPAEALLPEARAMAGLVAECKPECNAVVKRSLLTGETSSMEEAMANERALQQELRKLRGR
jgi:enoyl-CoA hydratase/carnithine racemase